MIRQNWWKFLGVALIIYVLLIGMLVPLKPGIYGVSPSSAKAGETVVMRVTGYNTHYLKQEGNIRAWLKLNDELALDGTILEVHNERELEVAFRLPPVLPVAQKVQDFTLVLDSPGDGATVLPGSIFITQEKVNAGAGLDLWPNAQLESLHSVDHMTFPFRNILAETIRNTYFHVPLWFAMLFLFLGSMIFSIRYLRHRHDIDDRKAVALTRAGILFGVLGLITGAIWAKFTWGAFWSWDIKQNMTAIGLLIYLAYFVLRNAFEEDPGRQGRLGAVYNIFAFAALIPLIYVIPRMTDSLHPGAGGNPAFGSDDLDNTMRMVFYPAIIGWTLIGFWIASISFRSDEIKARLEEEEFH